MGKDTWDAVLASSPLNTTAGRVTAKGYEYEPRVKVAANEWDAPPTFVAFVRQNPQQVNLVGHKFARLTVVGYLGDGKWCCRCACGKYVTRSQKAALNPANAEVDRCTTCRHTAYLQREASAERVAQRKALGQFGLPTFKDGRDA